jgi:hypothetical protein
MEITISSYEAVIIFIHSKNIYMVNNECIAFSLQLPNCEDIEILKSQYRTVSKIIILVSWSNFVGIFRIMNVTTL